MNRFNYLSIKTALILLIVFLFVVPALGEVRLPHVIGSGMVVQRDMAIPIWGWAEAGEKVSVEFAGQKVGTTADANGRWMVRLAAVKAGGAV